MKIKAIKKKVYKPLVCVMTASAVMAGVCGAENEANIPTGIFAATQDTPVLENKTNNFTWSISDGTLTFKGDKSGNIIIPDYTDNTGDNPAPWSSSKSAVGYSSIVFDCTKKVVIGENAFVRDNNNKSLGSITVKGTSGKISKGAFNGHTKISFLALYCAPAIEENAFEKDAVQRVAFYNNKPVEGLKFAIGNEIEGATTPYIEVSAHDAEWIGKTGAYFDMESVASEHPRSITVPDSADTEGMAIPDVLTINYYFDGKVVFNGKIAVNKKEQAETKSEVVETKEEAPKTDILETISTGAISYDTDGDGIDDVLIDSLDIRKLAVWISEINRKWTKNYKDDDKGLLDNIRITQGQMEEYKKEVSQYEELVK